MLNGMWRFELINKFIEQRNFTSFLEIGTYSGITTNNVHAPVKVSVDPDPNTPATFHMTSDDYFASATDTFDIIFIDGLHEHDQVYRDIMNSIRHLNKNGVIVLHDCLPTTEKMQAHYTYSYTGQPWTGDVWKAFVKARTELPFEMYTIMTDMGCGVIDISLEKRSETGTLPTDMEQMTYEQYCNNLGTWMNIKGAIQSD